MNDNTVVRVRVPKHLYEAIQKKLALKETEENVQESMQDIVQYLSDPEVLKTLGVVATALGITGGAKALADKIKSSGTDISSITGAQHGMDEAKTPSYVKSTDAEEDKPKYAGINMSKTNVMNKVGKGKQSKKITGARAAAYQPVHSGVYKEEEDMQTEAGGVEYAWIPAAAAGLGIAASMLKGIMSYMKQNNLKGMSGFMQAYKEVGKGTASGIERSKGV